MWLGIRFIELEMKSDRLDNALRREIDAERLHKSNDFQSVKIMYQSFFH